MRNCATIYIHPPSSVHTLRADLSASHLGPWPDTAWSSQSGEKSNMQVIFHKCSSFLQLVSQSIINGIISGVRTFGFCVPFLFLCELLSLGWVEHSVIKTFSIQLGGERVLSLGRLSENVKSTHVTQASHLQGRDTPQRRWWWWQGVMEIPRTAVIHTTDFIYMEQIQNQGYKVYVAYGPPAMAPCQCLFSIPCQPFLDIFVKVSETWMPFFFKYYFFPSTKFINSPLGKADNHLKQRGVYQKTAQPVWRPLRPA